MKFNFSSEWFFKLVMYAAPTLPPPVLAPNISARNQRRIDAKSQHKKHN
ncbi:MULTISPECIES: hypothetical protein [Stenotrophomonas]|nr:MULTISPECIES: hypothetical protein [Stenotrophomonas]MCU1136963.1 hypothetical protein [Stenotrophomonas maltophilia]MEC4339712.1 hypothetical protein [Stenotrophomonas pavanii]